MNQQEYSQIHEFGLGSLVGDFFENVKDTVKGVAKAVAPIAPYVLPFVMPGIGGAIGGKLGSFLASKGGQYLLGAGIQGLAGEKPADIAKNLALQVASSGIGGLAKGQSFMEGAFGPKFAPKAPPPSTNLQATLSQPSGGTFDISDASSVPKVDYSQASDKFTTNINLPTLGETPPPDQSLLSRLGTGFRKTFDPSMRSINPKYQQLINANISPEAIAKLGITKEAPFTYQYGPALYAGLTALPLAENFFFPREEEEVQTAYDLYMSDPEAYQISYVADGGPITGFAEGSGQKIQHPDGKIKEHPRRIGEIAGPGTGTSDDIPAMLSDGEFVMTAQAVRNAGGGSRKEGAKNMYKLMKNLEKGGSLSQQSLGIMGRS